MKVYLIQKRAEILTVTTGEVLAVCASGWVAANWCGPDAAACRFTVKDDIVSDDGWVNVPTHDLVGVLLQFGAVVYASTPDHGPVVMQAIDVIEYASQVPWQQAALNRGLGDGCE